MKEVLKVVQKKISIIYKKLQFLVKALFFIAKVIRLGQLFLLFLYNALFKGKTYLHCSKSIRDDFF